TPLTAYFSASGERQQDNEPYRDPRRWRRARRSHVHAHPDRETQRRRSAGLARRRPRPHRRHAADEARRPAPMELGRRTPPPKSRLTAAYAGGLPPSHHEGPRYVVAERPSGNIPAPLLPRRVFVERGKGKRLGVARP